MEITKEQEIAIRKIAVEAANVVCATSEYVATDDLISIADRVYKYITTGEYQMPVKYEDFA